MNRDTEDWKRDYRKQPAKTLSRLRTLLSLYRRTKQGELERRVLEIIRALEREKP